ncbi:MarR family winged helix-turn-helix transcriptional regulator [Mangrovihabitans endophyticus]|uniref:HTH marR-type domain-containing protein n=1 Tax=Mangrovihabitans endophyticus TaxID=1751298 RepID=A0A8J3C4M7_9ACTN|nr:MarR family transcriptional regulator [Mangrovihabitans endophyticus]GGL09333.1 hypothetical protein GCM10012284_49980 [Mangrovihabitans endophyticus]
MTNADDEVTDALLAMSRVLVGVAARSLSGIAEDVTLSQFRALVLLASRGPQRVVDLAQELGVTSSTATRMSDRLVRKGLAGRHERADDRRASWITLSPDGGRLVAVVMRARRAAIGDLVAQLPSPQPPGLAATLNAIAAAGGELTGTQWRVRMGAADEPVSQNYVQQ